jgi:glycerophosphoryl diester phosphodiesterase
VLVIAHRGASFDEPENTLPAFARAIELGADYVEFDVWNAEQVTHDRPRRGVSYPTLAEVLELCHGHIGVMVELKRPRGEMARRTLDLMRDDDVLVCFQRRAVEQAHALRPAVRTVQHVGFGTSIRAAAGGWAVGFQDERVTSRGLEKAQRLGLETTVYTVNDEARMAELAELGVGGIFTDRPDRALAVVRQAG